MTNAIEPHGQSWGKCDPDIKSFIKRIVATLKDRPGDNLAGIYLHGSLAMGSYYRPKSDLDLLVVVPDPLSPATRKSIAETIADLSDERPTTGDIELSVILEAHAKSFIHPLPYELHYSSMWKDKIREGAVDFTRNDTDSDLAAHCMTTTIHGICLFGKPIAEVFGPVPWSDYEYAVLDDFNWITAEENILESPFYGVLNSCRVLQLLTERTSHPVISKEEGALWALVHLPEEYHPVIEKALSAYRSNEPVSADERQKGGQTWDAKDLLSFRDFVSKEALKLQAGS